MKKIENSDTTSPLRQQNLPKTLPNTSIEDIHARSEGSLSSTSMLFENLLLNYELAAQYMGISVSYLRRLKSQGQIPWVAIGSRGVRFRKESLETWIKKREIK